MFYLFKFCSDILFTLRLPFILDIALNPHNENSHGNVTKHIANTDAPNGEDKKQTEQPEEKKEQKSSRKEKSVLQNKLTRLAIQIGYAGKSSHSV